MKSVVVYASRSGNTRRVAEEITRAVSELGEVEMYEVTDAPNRLPDADLLIVGGPTEGRSETPPMVEFLQRVDRASVADRAAVAFDTRLAWPRILSGSAAQGIAKRLRNAGARIVVDPESFIVDTKPELKSGELERAGSWARDITGRLGVSAPVAA